MAYRRRYRRFRSYRRSYRRSGRRGGMGGLTNPMFLAGLAIPFLMEYNDTAFKAAVVASAAPIRLGALKTVAKGYAIGQILENQFGNPIKK